MSGDEMTPQWKKFTGSKEQIEEMRNERKCTDCINRMPYTMGTGSYCTEHDTRIGDIDPVTCEFYVKKNDR
jgi:hypothetical protein